MKHHYISGKPSFLNNLVSTAEKFYYYLDLEQDELILGPTKRKAGIHLGFHVDDYTKVSDIDFKTFSAIISQIGGLVTILYIFTLPIMNMSNFNSYQKLNVKLADQSEDANEFEQDTIDLVKQRVSVEGIFTLFDQVNQIRE